MYGPILIVNMFFVDCSYEVELSEKG
jgi:hypothetical protein